MKHVFPLCLTIGILSIPLWSRAADTGRADDEQAITKIEHEWLDAIVKRDGSYLEKIEADNFVVTGPSGKTLDKAGDMKDTTTGETMFKDIKIDDLKVRFYGDTAIANGVASVSAHENNRNVSGKYAWTDVFVKTNGEWKAVSAQVTMIEPEHKASKKKSKE